MATTGQYYLNAVDLSSATTVYTNPGLTTVAPNGYYSDGGVVRQQVGGVLQAPSTCPSCTPSCGAGISASGQQGLYNLNVELGSATGAVVVRFEPYSVPDGIIAVFDGNTYNGLSSPGFGWLQGTLGLPTYIGDVDADCGIVAGSPYTLNEFLYSGNSFIPTGTTTNITIAPGQTQLTINAPNECVMVIPKLTASTSILSLDLIGPCSGTVFNIRVDCPAPLQTFQASSGHATSALACQDTIDQTVYWAQVGIFNMVTINTLVFSDPNGQFKLPAGFYKTTVISGFDWIEVSNNGIIVAIGSCAPPASVEVTSVLGFMAGCGGALNEYLGANVYLDGAVDADTTFDVQVSYVYPGNQCGQLGNLTQNLTVFVPNGSSSSSFDACASGVYVPGGANICDACIVSWDNPNVTVPPNLLCPQP